MSPGEFKFHRWRDDRPKPSHISAHERLLQIWENPLRFEEVGLDQLLVLTLTL